MARIARLTRAMRICFEAGVTPFLWGHKGVGKSSLFRRIAAENGWGFLDLRCSQIEAADLRGLPERTADGRTRFLPPADLPVGDLDDAEYAAQLGPPPGADADLRQRGEFLRRRRRLEPRRGRGILLLDELNRAPDDVLQAAFQLVLDRAVGEYVLPPGWHVAAAGNFGGGAYRVSDCDDPAFLDRFCHLVFPAGADDVARVGRLDVPDARRARRLGARHSSPPTSSTSTATSRGGSASRSPRRAARGTRWRGSWPPPGATSPIRPPSRSSSG